MRCQIARVIVHGLALGLTLSQVIFLSQVKARETLWYALHRGPSLLLAVGLTESDDWLARNDCTKTRPNWQDPSRSNKRSRPQPTQALEPPS